jgi:hypothetical protein
MLMDGQIKTPPPEAPAEAPKPAPQSAAQHTELPPAPAPEPVEATGPLDANGVPAPVPVSTEGGSVITPATAVPAKKGKAAASAAKKPLLPIAIAVVLFLTLCGLAMFAYSQS